MTLDLIVLDHAVPAEDLHAHPRDPDRFFGAKVFDQRRQLAQVAREALLTRFHGWSPWIHFGQPMQLAVEPLDKVVGHGRLHPQRAQPRDGGLHVEQHLGYQRVLANGLAHLYALPGVIGRRCQGCLSHATRLHADRDARLVHERGDLPPAIAG